MLVLVDRGFAGREFLSTLLDGQMRWIVRWRKDYHLVGPAGADASASQVPQRVRSKGAGEVARPEPRQTHRLGMAAVPVRLGGHATPVWLVVRRKGHERWWG